MVLFSTTTAPPLLSAPEPTAAAALLLAERKLALIDQAAVVADPARGAGRAHVADDGAAVQGQGPVVLDAGTADSRRSSGLPGTECRRRPP